jgi:nifR3 family TIM-barrel protein
MSLNSGQPKAVDPPNRAEALTIGAVQVANRVVLAPMSRITDAPFRRMAARLGAGLVVSEMTACSELVKRRPDVVLRTEAHGVGTHVVQLAGCEAHWMSEGARVAAGAGADIIDINMGCPARQVTNGQSGSALMRDLDHAQRLIEATVSAVAVPVTLKMRLGWDDRTINAPELARRAQACGVKLVTVHGRTRCQFYTGVADWTAVRAIKDAVTIPVVVNGDIKSEADAETALAASGADAVMIGRGAQGRPWLPGQIATWLATGRRLPEPALEMQLSLAAELYDGLLAHYGPALGVRHARKHLGWALDAAAADADASPGTLKSWRARVLTGTDPRQVLAALRDAFDAFAWKAAA